MKLNSKNIEIAVKALNDFKTEYPWVTTGDLQTFVIGYNASENKSIHNTNRTLESKTMGKYEVYQLKCDMCGGWFDFICGGIHVDKPQDKNLEFILGGEVYHTSKKENEEDFGKDHINVCRYCAVPEGWTSCGCGG